VILGFQSAGIWSISGKVDASGKAIQPMAADVNTIKGWMTLEQICTTYNVPLADLLKQFALPAETAPTTAIKDLESDRFSVSNLRTWLTSRSQPGAAAPVPSATPAPAIAPTATLSVLAAPTEHTAPDRTLTGKTTFQDLLNWGVSKEAIQNAIGAEMPLPAAVIKDYVTGKGLEFSTMKTKLQAEIDKIK
jgi:hypothetical protein